MSERRPSPALESKSEHYPAEYLGRVPKRVRMLRTVRSEWPFSAHRGAYKGDEYDADVNRHGAVSVYVEDGGLLGVKPGEFEVIEWH
jgi:hypothetical protein